MGFKVSRLTNVSGGKYGHYLFVVGEGTPAQRKWVKRNFDRLAKEIGPEAAIVTGHDEKLSDDIIEFLIRNASDQVAIAFQNTLSYVITKGDLETTKHPVFVFPFAQNGDGRSEAADFMTEITDIILQAIKNDRVKELARDLGCKKIRLKSSRPALWFSTLRRLNDVVTLQPSIMGCGINLNKLLEPIFDNPRLRR